MAKKSLVAGRMAARIYKREDNQYKESMIKEILNMYADEIHKAVIDGERVFIPKVGTIIPQVKTHIMDLRSSLLKHSRWQFWKRAVLYRRMLSWRMISQLKMKGRYDWLEVNGKTGMCGKVSRYFPDRGYGFVMGEDGNIIPSFT